MPLLDEIPCSVLGRVFRFVGYPADLISVAAACKTMSATVFDENEECFGFSSMELRHKSCCPMWESSGPDFKAKCFTAFPWHLHFGDGPDITVCLGQSVGSADTNVQQQKLLKRISSCVEDVCIRFDPAFRTLFSEAWFTTKFIPLMFSSPHFVAFQETHPAALGGPSSSQVRPVFKNVHTLEVSTELFAGESPLEMFPDLQKISFASKNFEGFLEFVSNMYRASSEASQPLVVHNVDIDVPQPQSSMSGLCGSLLQGPKDKIARYMTKMNSIFESELLRSVNVFRFTLVDILQKLEYEDSCVAPDVLDEEKVKLTLPAIRTLVLIFNRTSQMASYHGFRSVRCELDLSVSKDSMTRMYWQVNFVYPSSIYTRMYPQIFKEVSGLNSLDFLEIDLFDCDPMQLNSLIHLILEADKALSKGDSEFQLSSQPNFCVSVISVSDDRDDFHYYVDLVERVRATFEKVLVKWGVPHIDFVGF